MPQTVLVVRKSCYGEANMAESDGVYTDGTARNLTEYEQVQSCIACFIADVLDC